jgi:hypothetical protein
MTDDQPQAAPANVPAVAASEGKPAGPRLSRTLLINGLALLTEALGLRAARGAPGIATLGAALGGPARRVWPWAVGLATLATAGGTAVLLLWVYLAYMAAPPALASPLAWIHLEVGDVAASLVLLIAGVLALVTLIGRQRSVWPTAGRWARQVAVGVAAALFLYVTASAISSLIWERFWLDPQRLVRAVPLALAALLYFTLLERAIAPAFPADSLRALLTRWYLAVLISVELFLVLFVIGGQSSGIALLILPLQLILFVFIALVATWLGRLGRDTALAGAVLAALLFAWIVAATLPITS